MYGIRDNQKKLVPMIVLTEDAGIQEREWSEEKVARLWAYVNSLNHEGTFTVVTDDGEHVTSFVSGQEIGVITEHPVTHTTKLSPRDVVAIRRMIKNGVYQREIAEKFGVSLWTINSISTGRLRGDVEGAR